MFFVVDAEDAFFGEPSLALCGHEISNSFFSNKFQVFDLAHAVFCAVAFIHDREPVAREFRALATEIAGAFCAGAHFAVCAGHGHVLFSVLAAVTGVLFAQEGHADAAIHSARGDKVLSNFIFHF
jgi:hypothetical protein